MVRHDPERQLDQVEFLLTRIAETALINMPLDIPDSEARSESTQVRGA
jgi:hypothetical protein